MPELPEVEVVRRGLAAHITGATLVGTEVLHPRAVRSQPGGAAELEAGLDDVRVDAVRRRGKYLWLELTPRRAASGQTRCLLVHLGMSGQMLLGEPGEVTSPHLRIRSLLVTPDGRELELSFVDQRTFGRWELCDRVPATDGSGYRVPAAVAHIALDPLDPAFRCGESGAGHPEETLRDQTRPARPDRGLRDREHLRRRIPVGRAGPPAEEGHRDAAG
jgi:formamidopyrimidine-DNA glycosylase